MNDCKCKKPNLFSTIFCKSRKSSIDYVIEWAKQLDEEVKHLSKEVEDLSILVVGEPIDIETLLSGKANVVAEATAGNFASLDENGDLTDSGKKPSDFAPYTHSHVAIGSMRGDTEAEVNTVFDGESCICFKITKEGNEKVVTIDHDNIDNLGNALYPDTTPTASSQHPITSGGVYTALQGKADAVHSHEKISSEQNESSVETQQSGDILLQAGSAGLGHGSISLIAADAVVLEVEQETATVDGNNIVNLKRALQDPDTVPTQGSNKLITSGGVYAALNSGETYKKEEYSDSATAFEDSDVAKDIVEEGIHHISYTCTNPSPQEYYNNTYTKSSGILSVIHYTYRIPNSGTIRYRVKQTLITDLSTPSVYDTKSNVDIRYRTRLYYDYDCTQPVGEWSSWVSLIPETATLVEEDNPNPVSSEAVNEALRWTLSAKSSDDIVIPFAVDSGNFALVQDLSEYEALFSTFPGGSTEELPKLTVKISLFDEDIDDYVYFLGFCDRRSRIATIQGRPTLVEAFATIYVGNYTLHLTKDVINDTITLSVDSLDSILSGS